ncbi:MAG: cytochrome c [Candidatus Tumulicola sp.]
MKERSLIAAIVLFATVLFGLAPLVRPGVEIPTAQHHLLHAVMLGGAALAGILFAGGAARERPSGAGWLVVAMIAPVFAMLLMWPSEYAYFETHRFGHVLEHFGLVFFGVLTGYAGQRYANGIGWAAGISVVAMGLLSVWGYGVGPPGTPVAAAPASAPVSATSATGAPNAVRGSTVFAKNCAVCHGSAGAGGEGPSLRNERARKPLAAAEAWIRDPAPPMPKLFPGALSAQDVADVAAYVETLR